MLITPTVKSVIKQFKRLKKKNPRGKKQVTYTCYLKGTNQIIETVIVYLNKHCNIRNGL